MSSPGAVADVGCGDGGVLSRARAPRLRRAARRLRDRGRRGRDGGRAIRDRRGRGVRRRPRARRRRRVRPRVREPRARACPRARAAAARDDARRARGRRSRCRSSGTSPLDGRRRAPHPRRPGTSSASIGRAVRGLITDAGWQVRGEILDPLGLAVHLFDRRSLAARAKGTGKWAVRRAAAAVPPVGTRIFTLHYAVIATPAQGH